MLVRLKSALNGNLFFIATLCVLFGVYSSLQIVLALWHVEPDIVDTLNIWFGVRQSGIGWIKDYLVTPDNWLLSLVPLHFIAYSLLGPQFYVTILFGWIVFVACAVVSAGIAYVLGAKKAAIFVATGLLNLGLFAHSSGFASYPVSHNVTNLFGFSAFLLLLLWFKFASKISLAIMTILLTCGLISDPWMMASFILPICFSSIIIAMLPQFRNIRILAIIVIIATGATIILFETRLFGVLSFVPGLNASFADPAIVEQNALKVILIIGNLVDIASFACWNRDAVAIISILFIMITLTIYIETMTRSRPMIPAEQMALYLVAALSCGGSLAAITLMAAPVTDNSARLLINCPYFIIITFGVLAQKNWDQLPSLVRLASFGILVALVLSGVTSTAALWSSPHLEIQYSEASNLASFLRANELTYGYGPYWGSSANALTLASGDRIRVRPVTFDGATGRVEFGRRPQTNLRWYEQSDTPPDTREWFLIVQTDGEQCPYIQVCVDTATKQFGPPLRTLSHGPATILVWDHPLISYSSPPISVGLTR